MIPATLCPCAHCGRPLDLSTSHLEVPYRRRHWWQLKEQRSEYRCRRCGGFNRLRLSGAGAALYLALAALLAIGVWRQLPWPILGMGGLLSAALLFRHAVLLLPADHD